MGGEPYDERLTGDALAALPIPYTEEPIAGEVFSSSSPAGEFARDHLAPNWRRKELFSIAPFTGVMSGSPKRLSISAGAAIALGLAKDPTDDLDQERWSLLRDLARRAADLERPTICDSASRTIEGVVVESDGGVSEIPGPTPDPGHGE